MGHTVAVRRLLAVLAVLPLLAVVAACSGNAEHDGPAGAAATPSPGKTITMVPLPPAPPPSGKLIAHILQASHDGARNQFEIWVDNDTRRTIRPTRLTYHDRRFRTPLPGTRLREIPPRATFGFPVLLPDQPACDRTASSGVPTLTVDYTVRGKHTRVTIPVEDEADVIEQNTAATCLEHSVEKVAHLSWADEITASGDGGKGSVGTMTLLVDTTGRPGSTLVIDSIVGNPVLSPGEHGVYDANLTITGDQPPERVPVPLRPTRCDAHAFGESGNFNAFAFNVHLDGHPGQFVVRLGPGGSVNAIDFAKASCGFLTTISSES
jgi:hypothetical protein